VDDGSEETKGQLSWSILPTSVEKPIPISHFPQPNSTQTGLKFNPDFQGERPATGDTNHTTPVMCVCVCVCVCARAKDREREREETKNCNYRPKLNTIIKTRHVINCGSERTFLCVNVKENVYICCLVGQGSLVVE
jgi:hypothetical protein